LATSQSNLRAHAIGRTLVYGPRALFPPDTLDDFGWLEPELRLVYWKPPMKTYESLAIYCDSTVNREVAFLQPIIRSARWERYHDLATRPLWPTVDIQLSYFADQFEHLHQQVYALHTALTRLPFTPFGISAQRDVPIVKTRDDGQELDVLVSNGVQTLTFTTPALTDDPVTAHVLKLRDLLLGLVQPFVSNGWRERYDYDLDALAPLQAWDWDGRNPES
jgi:hypothetical protein